MATYTRLSDGIQRSFLDLVKPQFGAGEQFGASILGRHFDEILLRHDRNDQIFWCFMNQVGRPSYTYSLGAEVQQVQDWLADNYGRPANGGPDDLRYFVCGSKTPGIYNLGGDLRHFAECIRSRDLAAMRRYAETCVRMQYANYNAFGAPIITMALVQGDALGGGFEHALAFDILVAERSARLGLPEIVFNLFLAWAPTASCAGGSDGKWPKSSSWKARSTPPLNFMTWVSLISSLKMARARMPSSITAAGIPTDLPPKGRFTARGGFPILLNLKNCWRLPTSGQRQP